MLYKNEFALTWTPTDGASSPQEQLMSVSLMKPQGYTASSWGVSHRLFKMQRKMTCKVHVTFRAERVAVLDQSKHLEPGVHGNSHICDKPACLTGIRKSIAILKKTYLNQIVVSHYFLYNSLESLF